METLLGRLAGTFTDPDVPPRAERPKVRGDDLLPMDLPVVDSHLEGEASDFVMVVTVLNYLWLGGRDSERYRPQRRELTKGQTKAVEHLVERVKDFSLVDKTCPDFATARAELVEAKFDYAGEPIMALAELVASQVIPVWPEIGQAAVQPVLPYLPEELQVLVADPAACLLPASEWPARPPRSRVRGTQEEWDWIVRASSARGLVVAVDPEDVFKDHNGVKVLNGACCRQEAEECGRRDAPTSVTSRAGIATYLTWGN